MQLPNRDQAFIPREKLTAYLLSETHPVGKSKARFFRGLGFDDTNVDLLEQGLLTIGRTQEVIEEETTGHGVKYIVSGPLTAPGGLAPAVRTVWMIETGRTAPGFVTAYPD